MSVLKLHTNESSPRTVVVIAGVIRRINNKWQLINDQGHAPIGLKANITEPTTSSIQVNFEKSYAQVLTCSITADETYARRGFVFGGSCGLDKVIIYHSRAGEATLNTDLNILGSNIWIHVMMYE
ncbi:MAG: hypothetical protein IPF62_16755 [Bacteroidetes bacterium]|jgi:hypothetical protein|nr:hypothetical protein [Bacteroidota bacterium]HQW46151.1 hypothetical protein [Chitinophagaceae bacterium]MBK6821206.1 hypothetical protein [Bacteroidota bacterium]MBK7039791.1 hypothetical protein [Bacteroidota bacterium]MBK7587596.1 hypothetical protein [Bacteroidota bacterium]